MNITVKYFASLRELQGKGEEKLELDREMSVAEIWDQVCSSSDTVNVLMAINMAYVKPDTMVKEGDEIAFFPPVTGGQP